MEGNGGDDGEDQSAEHPACFGERERSSEIVCADECFECVGEVEGCIATGARALLELGGFGGGKFVGAKRGVEKRLLHVPGMSMSVCMFLGLWGACLKSCVFRLCICALIKPRARVRTSNAQQLRHATQHDCRNYSTKNTQHSHETPLIISRK